MTSRPSLPPARFLLPAAVLLAAGTALRLAAAGGDLWLDEIWSLALVTEVGRSVPRILGTVHDNNHLLNSLWLGLLPDHPSPWLARLPSLLASLLLMPVVAAAAIGRTPTERLLVLLFVAVSLPLVVIGTEARGYGLALLLTTAGWLCWSTPGDARPRLAGALFATAVCAHFSALFVYGALLVHSACHLALAPSAGRRALGLRLLGRHALPLAVSLAVGVFYVLRLTYGSPTPESGHFGFLRDWADYATGARDTVLAVPARVLLAALVLLGLRRLYLAKNYADFAFFAALPALPLLYIGLVRVAGLPHPPVELRYIILQLPFICLLAAHALAGGNRPAGPAGRAVPWLVGASAVLFLAGQTFRIAAWLPDRRGRYAAGAAYLVHQFGGRPVAFGTNADFRNLRLLDYYVTDRAAAAAWQFMPSDRWVEAGADYVLVYESDVRPSAVPVSFRSGNHRYRREAVFPGGGLSGGQWAFYRPESPGPAAAPR